MAVITEQQYASQENTRLQEVNKYKCLWQNVSPEDETVSALTACVQLTAVKLKAQRCLVSLVDRDYQLFVAEATQTSNLKSRFRDKSTSFELWQGCHGSTTRAQALCSRTILAEEVPDNYASFVVEDLTAIPEYADLPYVRREPHFRFYAGTPLISQAGHRIGSLFIIEDVPRTNFSSEDVRVLGFMAEVIMRQLDLEREFQQRLRYSRMTEGLTELVAPQISPSRKEAKKQQKLPPGIRNELRRSSSCRSQNTTNPDRNDGTSTPTFRRSISSDTDVSQRRSGKQTPDDAQILLENAARILCNSMDADETLFVDLEQQYARSTSDTEICELSAAAVIPHPEQSNDWHLRRKVLRDLKAEYPSGKIWLLDDAGNSSDNNSSHPADSDDGNSSTGTDLISIDSSVKQEIRTALREAFPRACQLIYLPLWDTLHGAGTSACFVISHTTLPALTNETDLQYLRVFTNSLAIVYSQSAVRRAEEQRQIFMSSISHELRTPLHGVVASTEILASTQLGPQQASLCKTIEMCGQTLLDTIEQVLDHTKVKHSAHKRATSRKRASSRPEAHRTKSSDGMVQRNIAALCEEAIDVVTFSRAASAKIKGIATTPTEEVTEFITGPVTRPEVLMLLHVDVEDWEFLCKPGEIRRICLNLVANSIKYTTKGQIKVSMEIRRDVKSHNNSNLDDNNDDDDSIQETVVLKVKDSGRGMSPDFLKNKLFTAFSQEDSGCEGLGLGLSIVQTLVQGMDGTINVESHPSWGTEFEITLPLQRKAAASSSSEVLEKVYSLPEQTTYSIAGKTLLESPELVENIKFYMETWYNCVVAADDAQPDWSFVDFEDDDEGQNADTCGKIGTIVVISRMSLINRDQPQTPGRPYINIPISPHKLSQVFEQVMQLRAYEEKPISDRMRTLQIPERLKSRGASPSARKNSFRSKLGRTEFHASIGGTTTSDSLQTPQSSARSSSLPSKTASIGLGRALCVDDNGINLRVLQANLKKLGYEDIQLAMNGKEALDAVTSASKPYNIIFMDLSMPVMDGFESTRKIRKYEKKNREHDPNTNEAVNSMKGEAATIVALTASSSEMDQKRAFDAGTDKLMTKPLRLRDLKSLIDDLQNEKR